MKLKIYEGNAKYKEVRVLQGYYAGRWSDLEEADADDYAQVKELKDDLKTYDENERVPHRIITRKVLNPNYDPSRARKSKAHGFAIVINNGDSSKQEVWFTDDPTIDYQYMIDSGFVNNSLHRLPAFLYDEGYDFIRDNFTRLEKDEYEQKKYYSYYTVFLSDGTRVKDVMYVRY